MPLPPSGADCPDYGSCISIVALEAMICGTSGDLTLTVKNTCTQTVAGRWCANYANGTCGDCGEWTLAPGQTFSDFMCNTNNTYRYWGTSPNLSPDGTVFCPSAIAMTCN
jgi:hypothetical protein